MATRRRGRCARRALVVGAAGTLGRSLLERLAGEAGLEVTAYDRTPAPAGLPARFVRGDLRRDRGLADLVRNQDVVFHLAHASVPLTADRDMVRDARDNLVPTLRLLRAIEEAGRRPLVVYPSSGGTVYGATVPGRRAREGDACLPGTSYGIQKLAAEHYLRLYAGRGALRAVVLRVSNAYGWLLPADRPQGLVGTAVTRALAGASVRIFGNPGNVRDYVHFRDVLEALALVLRREIPGGSATYNVGTGVGHTVTEVIAIIERHLGRPVAREHAEAAGARYLPTWAVLDAGKARRELGWSSTIDLDAGIAEMIRLGRRGRQRARTKR